MTAIEVENLTCGYEEHVVLKNISFYVQPQELMFIIGGSGCGKSTLLRCLIGLLQPHTGKISYFGKNFMRANEERRHALLKTFGVLYQNNALWSSMSVGENLSLALEQYTSLSRKDREEIVALKLAQVGLPGVEDFFPRELSGGMQKRVALARALVLDPKIVFFDEPSSGLDPVISREIDELIKEVRDTLGTTMVIISHQLSSIFGIADRIILLDQKEQGIIADGNPRKLIQESTDERVLRFLKN